MSICPYCNNKTEDNDQYCHHCHTDLEKVNAARYALNEFMNNYRIRYVRISTAKDACAECNKYQGIYLKEDLPLLPIVGCSNPDSCRCFYEPKLEEIYP